MRGSVFSKGYGSPNDRFNNRRRKLEARRPIYCPRCGMKMLRLVGGVATRKCYCEAKK